MPYTGEGVKGSRLAFDKILSKTQFDEEGVPTGRWHIITDGEVLVSIRPSSLRHRARAPALACISLKRPRVFRLALEDCFRFGKEVLVEEYFAGRELTIGILGDEALPVVEIVPREGFYDYQHKYTKGASQYCSGRYWR